jgi:ligand-binding sensor domain-containing protein/signal transduction histidine kinase
MTLKAFPYFIDMNFVKKIQHIIFLFLLLSINVKPSADVFALDPNKSITQYILDTWQEDAYLPQNTIDAIVQTKDGYVWFGTFEGLVHFDGVKFVVFDKNNTEEIKHNHISTLFEDSKGNLWIGTNGGGLNKLSYKSGSSSDVKGENFVSYTTKDGLSNDFVRKIFEDKKGNIWIGTRGGLNLLKSDANNEKVNFEIYTTKEGLSNDFVRDIYEDSKGNLWVGTNGGGLNKLILSQNLKDVKFNVYTTNNGLSNNFVHSIAEDNEENLWIATENGLNKLSAEGISASGGKSDNAIFTVYTTKDGLSNNFIWVVYKDTDGNLWIGTVDGLNRLKSSNFGEIKSGDSKQIFGTFSTRDGLSNNFVRSIYEDREGNIWIGTRNGLNCLKDARFTTYTTKEGLTNDFVKCVYEDSKGNIWVGTQGGGLNKLILHNGGVKSVEITTYTMKDGLSNNLVRSIYEDEEGNLWIGTDGGGLNKLKNNKFTVYTSNNGLSSDFIFSICSDGEGGIWIGTDGGGIINFNAGKFINYTTKDGLSNDVVNSIYRSNDGSIWIGTNGGGLNRMKNGKFTSYTTKNGLSNDFIFSIYEDSEGIIWVGTNGGGLNRFSPSHSSEGKFVTYTTKIGLFDNVILQILEDKVGNLWIGCNRGIFKVSKNELNGFALGKIKSITSIPFGKYDGMKSIECSAVSDPPAFRDKQGRLWFSTLKGVTMFDPENINLNKLPPPVVIENVIVDNEKIFPISDLEFYNPKSEIGNHKSEIMSIEPGKNRFEFHYTALSFTAPEKVKFKFKLEGFDKGWVDAGTRRTAYYTNISPGNYKFKVIASNNDGVWNETGSEFNFYLKPYFYQTFLFYLICGLGVIFAGIGIYRVRVKNLKVREKELVTLVEERTKKLLEEKEKAERSGKEAEDQRQIAEKALKDLEIQTQKLLESEKMASLGQLVAGIAHEINNPVNFIYANVPYLEKYVSEFKNLVTDLEKLLPEENVQKFLQIKSNRDYEFIIKDTEALLKSYRDGAERIKNIILNLRSFSRLDEAELKEIDIHQGIESTLMLFLSQYKDALVVHKEYSNIPNINCYASQLNQVFMNLLVNSAQAIEERNKLENRNRGNIWIKTELVNSDEKLVISNERLENSIANSEIVRISIKDDGIGIPEDICEKIFDPFFTTKPIGKGTGLGLSISYGIIEKHKGKIYFNTKVGTGTEFVVELPVNIPEN